MKKIIAFFKDVVCFRKNPAHVINKSSYYIMRRLDICSLGLTTSILKCILAPRQYRSQDTVSNELHTTGFAKLGNFFGPCLQELMRLPVFCRAKPELAGTIDAIEPAAKEILGRLDVRDVDFLKSKAITEFIVNAPFLEIAKKHYGCDVVCTRASSWWSIPCTASKGLDGAAQKFHRDIDWLGELKFFIFATDVTPENGPFDLIKESHRKRLDKFMLRDGRIEEADMFASYDKEKHLASTLCTAGDTYAVDTRGYHRGRPVISGRRCVLCVEFSLNKFGAEQQYSPRPALDPSWESYPVWQKAIQEEPAWAGIFN